MSLLTAGTDPESVESSTPSQRCTNVILLPEESGETRHAVWHFSPPATQLGGEKCDEKSVLESLWKRLQRTELKTCWVWEGVEDKTDGLGVACRDEERKRALWGESLCITSPMLLKQIRTSRVPAKIKKTLSAQFALDRSVPLVISHLLRSSAPLTYSALY